MTLNRLAGVVALVAICCAFSACTTVRYTHTTVAPAKHHGPPPHAPAHGYRHKHGDVVLLFDSSLGLYMVSGRSNCYFHDKYYYRTTRSGWEITSSIDGPWRPVSTKKLPKGLRKMVHAKQSKKKK